MAQGPERSASNTTSEESLPGPDCLDDNALAELIERGSEDLRRRAEIHVDRCARCRRLLSALSGGSSTSSPRPMSDSTILATEPNGPLEAGVRVDHFVIIGLIGRGGMGEVYLARDEQLRRKVALKLVSSKKAESVDLEQEARITARLAHPNIVTVHAVGRYAGRPYVALEYVPGGTLGARMANGPLSQREAVTTSLSIAEALAHSHERGVLHRDLKPNNVLIDQDGRARVADFGLAAVVDADPARDDTIDVSSLPGFGGSGAPRPIGGTPAYMAPERWEGATASPAADVWALGAMMFEMLAGEHPFGRGSTAAVVEAIRTRATPPELPPTAQASPELAALVRRCLERRPEARPSAKEVARVLAALVHGTLPTTDDRAQVALLVSTTPRISPRRSPLRWIALGGGIAVTAAAIALGVRFIQDGARTTSVHSKASSTPTASPTADVAPAWAPKVIEGESCSFVLVDKGGASHSFGGPRITLPSRGTSYIAAVSAGPMFQFYCTDKMSDNTLYTLTITLPRTKLVRGRAPASDSDGSAVNVSFGGLPPHGMPSGTYYSSDEATVPNPFGRLDIQEAPDAPGDKFEGTLDATLMCSGKDDIIHVHVTFEFRI